MREIACLDKPFSRQTRRRTQLPTLRVSIIAKAGAYFPIFRLCLALSHAWAARVRAKAHKEIQDLKETPDLKAIRDPKAILVPKGILGIQDRKAILAPV